ncbi:MAG: hypothetical protein U0326_06370 [Polyangiales bacterium]
MFKYLTPERVKRALLGADLPKTPRPAPRDSSDFPKADALTRLVEQVKCAHGAERARAEENRRRSEVLSERLLTTLPVLAALAGYSASQHNSTLWIVAAVVSIVAVFTALVAKLAILHNLGKDEWFEPLASNDFASSGPVSSVPDAQLVDDHLWAMTHDEPAINDNVDRLHTAHALFTASVVLASIGAALSVKAAVSSQPLAPPATHQLPVPRGAGQPSQSSSSATERPKLQDGGPPPTDGAVFTEMSRDAPSVLSGDAIAVATPSVRDHRP